MSNKQRRKGNAQGASSARAAELLQATGNLGFDALSLIPGLVDDAGDATSLMDEIGLNVDPGLRIIFKKLSKRDAQTREKAIKELFEELKNSVTDVGKIKNSFPCFASSFSRLISDCSPVVRSVSDSILALYITILKKEAGPQLKNVIPFLFFSGQDGYHTVVNSAEASIKECFPTEEKRKLAVDTFGQDVVGICLQILGKQHKLVLPQKFTEEENDLQRQTRLLAQSVNTLEKFLDCAPGLEESIGSQFASSATFNTLMNLDVSVKAAAFRLLQKLIRKNVGLILQTRIPSFILQNLSAEDTLLCRNCFECFLVAASDPKFYDVCKIDKAVIPKILHLVRKKGLHWNVLESSLLPSISVIYENLGVSEKEKWLKDVVLSFFDDVETGIPLQSWSKAISEALKFSFLKSSELNQDEFLQFLFDQVLRFVGITVSFGEKQPVDVVVEFLTWIQSKTEMLGEVFVGNFMEKICQKLVVLLPKSIPILEGYILNANDFKTTVEVLKNEKCPNETFLKFFKTLDSDAVDLKLFGKIISSRIQKESNFENLKQFTSILVELIEDGEIQGPLKNFIPEISPSIAWSLMSVVDDDTVEVVDDLDHVVEIAMEDLLKGRILMKEDLIEDFLEKRLTLERKERILKTVIQSSENLMIEGFLNLIAVSGKMSEDFGEFLLEKLIGIFLENPEDEDGEIVLDVRNKTADFGKQLSRRSFGNLTKKITDENFPVKNLLRLSNLLASVNLSKEQILDFLPHEEFVKDWIHRLGSKYLLNLVAEPDSSRLVPIAVSPHKFGKEVNVSEGVRLAIFYGNFAYFSMEKFEEKSVFSNVSAFLLSMELAVTLKTGNGMFSSEGVEFKEFQNLMNIIDRILQDSRFEYQKFFSNVDPNCPELFVFASALNDLCKLENRRHVPPLTVEIPKNSSHMELLQIIEDCEEASKSPEIGTVFLQQFSEERRKEYENWMFNFGQEERVKEAVSYFSDFLVTKVCTAFMKLSYNEIKEAEVPPWVLEKMESEQMKRWNLSSHEKLAVFLILNDVKDSCKHSGIFLVKYVMHLPVKYSDEFLAVIFELLPKEPERHLKEYSFKGKLDIKRIFSHRFDIRYSDSTTFEHYVLNLLFKTCTTLPSIVREWFVGLPKSKSGEVHEYVKKYLSPLLISRELAATSNIKRGRLSITVMPAVHEIQAGYKFDDATLLLQISLADNYPLSNPTVEAERAIVNKDVLRKWLLQLIQFLKNENGLMLDGILQWKRNIDNHLDGIEECTICMMTVSTTNYSLPKIKCRQCKKKFHGNCLYKWFDSSNNPTCPLCRAPFF
ncbi:hypothetical protein FO519_007816 [Halicephalobus sp. NKZ332]|nr:hypothetical protein FO519_007816 [Halicephalobus sp. NKZ332]